MEKWEISTEDKITGWKVKEYMCWLPDAVFPHMLLLQKSPTLFLHVIWCPCFFPSTAFVLQALDRPFLLEWGYHTQIASQQISQLFPGHQANAGCFHSCFFFQGMFISWNYWRTFVCHALSRLPSAKQLGNMKWWVTIWKCHRWGSTMLGADCHQVLLQPPILSLHCWLSPPLSLSFLLGSPRYNSSFHYMYSLPLSLLT